MIHEHSNGLIHIKNKHQCLIYPIKTDCVNSENLCDIHIHVHASICQNIFRTLYFFFMSERLKLSKPPYTNNSPQSTNTYTHNTNTL